MLHVHLSGGEPGARRDLVEIAASAREAGLYTNLITSGVGITTRTMRDLWEAGLDHVQVSIQDADAVSADHIAGYRGAFQRKHALAAEAVRLGLPLTVNLVVHRANIERIGDMVDLALELRRQPHRDRARAVLRLGAEEPRGADADRRAGGARRRPRSRSCARRHHGRIVIDAVVPDYHARFPKPCVGGWGRRSLNVTPSGRVLPCHAAESIPELEFWNVREHSLADIWANSPAFNAFRGTDFLPEPCASCERREIDFGGCRCQAFLLTGDARGDRSGLPLVAASRPCHRACCGAGGRGLRLPAHVSEPETRESDCGRGPIVRNSAGKAARCDAGPGVEAG